MKKRNDKLFNLDEAVVTASPAHGGGVAALNHKTLDWEIACQEKSVASLEGLLANERAVLQALYDERDSAQRLARRVTEREDGTPIVPAEQPQRRIA